MGGLAVILPLMLEFKYITFGMTNILLGRRSMVSKPRTMPLDDFKNGPMEEANKLAQKP